jgi:hypothetical protein
MPLEDFLPPELPAPRNDDLIFRADQNEVLANACINWAGSPD